MNKLLFLISLVFLLLVANVGIAKAQLEQQQQTLQQLEQTGIVPCGTSANPTPCGTCDAFKLAKNVTDFIVAAGLLIATGFIGYGGFLILIGAYSEAEVKKGKEAITAAVIGVLIILGAWLIVDTAIKVLLGENVLKGAGTTSSGFFFNQLGPWNSINCQALESFVPAITVPGVPSAALPPGVTPAGVFSDEQSARQFLLSGTGVEINHSNACASGQTTSCTSLANMRYSTLNEVTQLKQACGNNCFVQVTGGTEEGHAGGERSYSHANGYKVDISSGNAATNQYILNNFAPSGTRDDGAALYKNPKTGALYAKEGNHWDILVAPKN